MGNKASKPKVKSSAEINADIRNAEDEVNCVKKDAEETSRKVEREIQDKFNAKKIQDEINRVADIAKIESKRLSEELKIKQNNRHYV